MAGSAGATIEHGGWWVVAGIPRTTGNLCVDVFGSEHMFDDISRLRHVLGRPTASAEARPLTNVDTNRYSAGSL